MKFKIKKISYKNLPKSHQLAIAHYMAIDGCAWESFGIMGQRQAYLKSQLKKTLPLFVRKYGKCKFGVTEISSNILIEKIMKLEGVSKDFKTFEKYHKWYKINCSIPHYSSKNRWPCILDSCDDEIYNNVLEDGWHRFHSYVSTGHKTIPCVCYLEKENYLYSNNS